MKDEINSVFSPDGKMFFFSIDTYKNTSKAGRSYTIMFMREEENVWTKARIAPFALKYMSADMCMTYDGERLFFCSDRPLEENEPPKKDSDIWYIEKIRNGWSEVRNPGALINSDRNEWYPSVARNGTLYFSSNRSGGKGSSDIYMSRFRDGAYQKAKNLGEPISTRYNEGDVFISSDESYMIVVSSHRPDSFGSGDLYISFRKQDGTWLELKNMGERINTPALEYCPMVSPDGKYFFFTSRRRGNDDIYWVDSGIIDELRPEK